VALLLLLGAKWLAAYIDQHAKPAAASAALKPPPSVDWRSPSFIPHVRPSDIDRDSWRVAVNSKIVEFAWEKFCNSILQEVHHAPVVACLRAPLIHHLRAVGVRCMVCVLDA
jgi:hypothetical protein